MSYVKTVWQDLPDRTTPITASRLNNLESQYDVGMADFGVGVSVKAHGAVGDGVADDTAAIQSAITAGAGGVVFFPEGSYKIAGNLAVPANTAITGGAGRATITQTAVNTVAMTVTTGCSVSGINFVGRGAAGYNASTQTSEVCLQVSDAAGASVTRCKFTDVGSIGVQIVGSTNVEVEDLVVVGPGSPTITAGDGVCYGILVDNSSRVSISGCDVSELCQGIIGSITVTDLSVTDSFVYNIRGQHGLYLQNGSGLKVSGLNVYNTHFAGIKTQIYAESAADSVGATISDVTIRNSGSDAVLFDNTDSLLTRKYVGVNISGVVAIDCSRGVYVKCGRGVTMSDVTIVNSGLDGVSLLDCWDVSLSGVNVITSGYNGIRLGAVTNGTNERITVSDCRVRNPGQSNVASNLYGVMISDGTDVTVDGLVVSATNTFMVYGLFFEVGDQASFTLMNSDVSGSTVSVRGLASGMKRWHNNKLSGSIQNITGLTTTTAPAAGGAGALPATPLGYYVVNVAGVDRKVPYYA